MALTPSTIPALLARHGLRPSRALGQNFLADANTARRIARLAEVEPGDRVLEIGPGIGSLTVALLDAGATVTALELDRHVIPALEETVGVDAVRVIVGDALRVDLAAVLGPEADAPPWSMVSNLPYNVATPIVMRLLESAPAIRTMLVMVQREVGERIASGPGSKAYGAVSVKVAYYGRAEVVGLVPPSVFIPAPKVDSALVRIVRHAEPPVSVPSPDRMFALVRAGFGQRRKMLRGALRAELGAEVESLLESAHIDPRARAETLTLDDWAALAAGGGHVSASGGAAFARVAAPAKLTLTLRVLGTRADGFHELEALTVMLSAPADALVIREGLPGIVELTVHGGGADVPRDESNLVVRAARAVLPEGAGVTIELTKVIPSGAGLGGGSADAAAVLRVLRDRFDGDAGAAEAAAARLGSDVPVCLRGEPVVMRGRGEVLEAVELAGELAVVVATPPLFLATPAVFAAWDALSVPRRSRAVEPPVAVAHLVEELTNDLEAAAEVVEPRIRDFRDAIERVARGPALMAGSGSSYWIPVEDAAAAGDLAARLSDELKIEAFAGHALREPVA